MTGPDLYGVHIDTNEDGTFEHSYTNDTLANAKTSRLMDFTIFDPERSGDIVRPKEADITLSNEDGTLASTFSFGDRVLLEKGASSTEVFYGEVVTIEKKDGQVVLGCKDMTNRMFRDNLKYNIFDNYVDREYFEIPPSPKKFQDYIPRIFMLNAPSIYASWAFNGGYAVLSQGISGATPFYGHIYDEIHVGPAFELHYLRSACFKDKFVWMGASKNGVEKFHLSDMSSTMSTTWQDSGSLYVPFGVTRKNLSDYFVAYSGSSTIVCTSPSPTRIADTWTMKSRGGGHSGVYYSADFSEDDSRCVLVGYEIVTTSDGNFTATTDVTGAYQSAITNSDQYILNDVAVVSTATGFYAIAVGYDRNSAYTPARSVDHRSYSKRGVIVKIDGTNITKIRDDRNDAERRSTVSRGQGCHPVDPVAICGGQ